MCAHYTIFLQQDELRDIVAAAEKNLATPTLNFKMGTRDIWPGYVAPVMMPDGGTLRPTYMRWGYPLRKKKKIQKDPKNPEYTTRYVQNAKLEEAQEKPFWQDSLEERRCLIPVSGFYEWKTLEDGQKQPYLFTLPQSSIMYMAGMYKYFKTDDGPYFPYYTMLTTQPTEEVSAVHDRMPVVLSEAEHEIWLGDSFMEMVNRSNIHLQAAATTKDQM